MDGHERWSRDKLLWHSYAKVSIYCGLFVFGLKDFFCYRYTSFQVHPTDEVRNIMTMDQCVLILTTSGLRSQLRRGIPCFTHTSDDMYDLILSSPIGTIF